MLICPVRECRLPLVRLATQVCCERGHSFDVARTGYVNLLQPQDSRSRAPGDTLEAVHARRRLHDRGITAPLLRRIAEILSATSGQHVLDAGCGDGYYLGKLANRTGVSAHGIDISAPAIDLAARRYPDCEWIVANADRSIPYADSTFGAVLSITARRNSAEFHRVLAVDGRLLIAIPAPDDLIELRGPQTRDRVAATIAEFSSQFCLLNQARATTTAHLDAKGVGDVLHAIYRPLCTELARPMDITFSLDLLLFQRMTGVQ